MIKLPNLVAIKRYFEQDGGHKFNMAELKALSKEEKEELGALCAIELGVEIK